jgi:hypothetical protein
VKRVFWDSDFSSSGCHPLTFYCRTLNELSFREKAFKRRLWRHQLWIYQAAALDESGMDTDKPLST